MKLFQLGKGVYTYYKRKVKDNKNTPYEIVQKKLTRNVLLAIKVPLENQDEIQLYFYGYLHIFVKKNKIIQIKNHNGSSLNWFYKNTEMYNDLNKKLGIDDYKKSPLKVGV